MPLDMQPPLEARVLPDDPPRAGRGAWKSWLLACAVFLGFVLCFAAAMWGLGKLLARNSGARQAHAGSLIHRWETPQERLAAIRTAWEAEEVGCTPGELREFNRLFAQIADPAQGGKSFRNLVDLDALADRIVLHPLLAERKVDRSRLERQLQYQVEGPGGYTEYAVARAEHSAAGTEALVYTVASAPYVDPAPIRWWLVRSGRTWHVCDWEQIDEGYGLATYWAIDQALQADDNEAIFREAMSAITSAHSALHGDNQQPAVKQLLGVQDLKIPAIGQDLVQSELARAWRACSRPEQSLAACRKISHPEDSPSAAYYEALAHAELEEYAAAVQAAAEYRRQAGPHPHLLAIEAAALEALGRRQDAAQAWSQRLRLTPEDTAALAEYCRLAEGGGVERVAQVLKHTQRPVEFAVKAATGAIYRDDDATLAAVQRFLEQQPGEAAAAEYIEGLRWQHQDDFGKAAEHFRLAAKQAKEDDERKDYFEYFLTAMAQAGRAAEGYAEASDPAEAFAFLTEGLDARGAPVSVSDLLPLLVAHRQKTPRDPRLHYCEGLWEISRDNFAAAGKALATAEQNAGNDDDLRQQAREKRREAVYRQGRVAEAYHSAGRGKDAAFRELAWLCKRDENWSALAELLALHRQEQAEDPWLGYFTALREQALGKSELALAAVQRAESAADESLRYLLASLKDELTIESGGVTQAYLNGNDRREAFRRLAPLLADANDWAGLLKLTELHSATSSQRRSSSLYWATQAHFHRGEYQAIVDSLTPWPSDRLSRLERTQIEELWDLLVRSQLRLGQLDAAQTAANQARDDNGLELPLVAVAVAKKDQVALRDLFGQRRLANVLTERQLHDDPELSPLLTNPELTEIRRLHGLSSPADEGRRNLSLVFFFPKPVDSTPLKTIVAGVIPSDKAAHEVSSPGRQSALWQFDSAALVLTWAEGSYCDRAAIPKTLRSSDPCRAVLEQHAGWAALDVLQGDLAGPQNDALDRAHRYLASALAGLGAQAIYVLPANSPNRLTLLDGQITLQLKSGEFFQPQPRRWSSSEFWLVAPENAEHAAAPTSLLRRELRQLADRSRVANPAGQALVRIRLARGHAREDQWLKVIRSRGGPDCNEEFFAEMTTESQLWPHLRPGERLNLNLYEPLEVRPSE